MSRQRVRFETREDMISALPDSLLDHILSFLPTKDAVATSILSKRWKPIWRSQLNLYLDDEPFPDAFSFNQFFHSFITTRDNTLPILSFHLKSRHQFFFCEDDFVYPAITRGVQTLIIDLLHPTTLPSIVLNTKTLSVLQLKRVAVNYDPYVDLPSLKVLHLESVTFTCEAYLHKLLSGCPILHELESYDLRMAIPTMMPPLGITISSLVRASVSGQSFIGLECLHNVDHLRMYVNRTPPTIRGVFHNLTHLELIFNFDDPFFGSKKWLWFSNLLQNTPNLQTLIIHEVDVVLRLRYTPSRVWEEPEIVPECLLSHLTTCSLINYSLINCELRFAKYIMQNSRLLSSMTIQSATFLDTNSKLQMLIELSSCPRISPTSKLLFI